MIRPFCKACGSPARELVEFIHLKAYITEEDSAPRVRRLHLMVVDLHRRRRMADRVLRLLVDLQVDRCAEECLHTLPIPWKQNQEAYQLSHVFGYAMEGSDLPCYILWPTRTAEQSFWCIDAWKGDWVRLDKCAYMAPLGIEHFFDAFCFDPQRPWGTAAIQALGIPSCRVSKDAYLENMHVNTFSDNSSTDSDRFDTAYDAFRDTTLTSDGTPEVSPVRMRLVFYYWMDKRSCTSWCICPEPGR